MQLDLLQYPQSAGFKTGGASREAAHLIDRTGAAINTKARIMACLKRHGRDMTAEEIHDLVLGSLNNVRSRLSELLASGLVEKLEMRGEAESGVHIHKWRVV
jgi:DNA-binding transcriptional ArsR family regulator